MAMKVDKEAFYRRAKVFYTALKVYKLIACYPVTIMHYLTMSKLVHLVKISVVLLLYLLFEIFTFFGFLLLVVFS